MQLDETVRLLDRLNRSHGHRLPEKQVARVEPRSDSPTVEPDSIRQYSDSLTVRQSAQSDSPTRSKSTVQYSVGPGSCREYFVQKHYKWVIFRCNATGDALSLHSLRGTPRA